MSEVSLCSTQILQTYKTVKRYPIPYNAFNVLFAQLRTKIVYPDICVSWVLLFIYSFFCEAYTLLSMENVLGPYFPKFLWVRLTQHMELPQCVFRNYWFASSGKFDSWYHTSDSWKFEISVKSLAFTLSFSGGGGVNAYNLLKCLLAYIIWFYTSI